MLPSSSAPPEVCPVCGGAGLRLAVTAPDRHFRQPGLHQVWQCGQCASGHTRPSLAPLARQGAYPAEYACYRQVSRAATGLRAVVAAAVLDSLGYAQGRPVLWLRPWGRLLATLRCWSWCPPPPPPGRLLDVGCGSGAYGASLMRLGWEVHGVEPDAEAAARARSAGLTVFSGGVLETRLEPQHYDAITILHVLEHLDDPVAALQHLRPALRQDGRLLVELPNWQARVRRLTGSYWFHLDLPRHRVHFSAAGLRIALARASFDVLKVQQIPNPHGLAGAIAYRWGESLRWSPPVQALGWAAGMAAALAGGADILRVTASPCP